MGWIYRIISPSGKSYIGQTTYEHVSSRWCQEKKYPHGALKRVFSKYGVENCIFEVLMEINEETHGGRWRDYLNFWERVCIDEYDSLTPNGYNLTDGGKNCKMSVVTRQRMSESRQGERHPMFGKKHTEESRRKMSTSLTGLMIGERNPNFGKPFPAEAKQKMIATKLASNLKGERAVNNKNIEQWSKDGKELIKVWASARVAEAALKAQGLKINYKNISAVLKGKRPLAGGFVWRFH